MFKPTLKQTAARYYRLEICANLFDEFSVMREWGLCGGKGRQVINLFPDLMSASQAADQLRCEKLRKGYQREV